MLAEIRQALAAALVARVGDVMQVSAYVLSSPTPPTITVFPASTQYDVAMANNFTMGAARAGTDQWSFTVRAYVAEMGDQQAQILLDRFLEPSGGVSVKEAIEAFDYSTVAGNIDDASVTSMNGYTQYQIEGVTAPVLGAEWTVAVLAG